MLVRSRYTKFCWNGIPATVRHTYSGMSLQGAVATSIFWHVIGLFLLWGLIFSLKSMGLLPKHIVKPEVKKPNIELILNHKQVEIPQKPMPVQAPKKVAPVVNHSVAKKIVAAKQPAFMNKLQSLTKSNTPAKSKSSAPSRATVHSHSVGVSHAPATHKPSGAAKGSSTKKSVGYGGSAHKNSHSSSVPALSMPDVKSMSSGLGGGSSSGRRHSVGVGSGAPSAGSMDRAFSSGSGNSSHSSFDRSAVRKSVAPYDISPYVSELKRNIRWNWRAPQGHSARVELFLRIAKDGRVVILNVKRTSEVGAVDSAALSAVRKCMPLNPLPSRYTKNYLDVVFVFDGSSVTSRY